MQAWRIANFTRKTVVKFCYLEYDKRERFQRDISNRKKVIDVKNKGWTALALALSAVMTFTSPACFLPGSAAYVQAEEVDAQAEDAQEAASTAAEEASTEGTTTEEVPETTTAKKEETTQSTKSEEQTTQASSETDSEEGTTQKRTPSTESTTEEESSEKKTTSKKKQTISSAEDAEIGTDAVKDIANEETAEDAPDGTDKTGTVIPKIYNDTRLAMKNNKEYIAGYVYFNQTDSAWNQNGYCIARAGCGPTSMAVVITSLTGLWVTPIDTAAWGYSHGYYSSAGSAHEMIPALAAAYGISCEGVGTSYQAIKEALQAGKPVVALMGPGYFTKGGHFMVLVDIDENDCVTVADVASRERSSYKYHLSDIIAQSKAASAGGPFWVMTYKDAKDTKAAGSTKKAKKEKKRAIKNYTKKKLAEDFADTNLFRVSGDLPAGLQGAENVEVTVKKVIAVLTMKTGGADALLLGGEGGMLSPVGYTERVIVDGAGSETTGEEIALSAETLELKRDIAKRQWESRLSLEDLEAYMEGTINREP